MFDRMVSRLEKLILSSCVIFTLSLLAPAHLFSQSSDRTRIPKSSDSLDAIRSEYVRATEDYKASLRTLLALYEAEAERAAKRLTELETLYEQGLISRRALEEQRRAVAAARDKVETTKHQIADAEAQIAAALLEAEEAKTEAARATSTRPLVKTTSLIRYGGASSWSISDAWKVQLFFQNRFGRPLPISAFGQSTVHDRWGLDHRNSLDVPIHPDSVEGQALMGFLRANGIPFLAFRTASPGAATGPHIHIGYPSHSLRR
jgi:hypothetical protein